MMPGIILVSMSCGVSRRPALPFLRDPRPERRQRCYPPRPSMLHFALVCCAFLSLSGVRSLAACPEAQEPPVVVTQPQTPPPQTPPPQPTQPAGAQPAGAQPGPGGEAAAAEGDPATRGRRGRGRGRGGDDAGGEDKPEEKQPKPGIPVTDALIQLKCVGCHQRDDRGHMTRISYLRKSPEGWAETLKRMGRLYNVQLTPNEAKQMVRYLASAHGLTRSEAERGLYVSERRVHWSEESHDADFKQACAQCHTLGKVFGQQRDAEEWQLLRATHVAYFPLSRGQMGGGPRDEEEEARRAEMRQRMNATSGGAAGGNQGSSNQGPGNQGGGNQGGRRGGGEGEGDRGDRVLRRLSEQQPLLTPEWEQWQVHKREVPLAGTWLVTGHEISRGDLSGTLTITRTASDEFETKWDLEWSFGDRQTRSGKGLLYAGYSWRGSATANGDTSPWREVLLLDAGWQSLKGRLFRGDADEFGADVTLHRLSGVPRVLAVRQWAVTVPALDHPLELVGDAFPESVQPSDFHFGTGITVKTATRVDARTVRVTIDVLSDVACGERIVSYGADPGRAKIYVYDAIDYLRIAPVQGLARIGGGNAPKQMERFEAVAVHRGKDGKPYTDDDVDVMAVKARWSLAEFFVRDDDDDVKYVGSIDPDSGVFTPAIDGPNPLRKWQANNVGDVFVVAEAEFDTPVRPPEPKKEEPKAPPKDAPKPDAPAGEAPPAERPAQPPVEQPADKPAEKPAEKPPAKPKEPPVARKPEMQRKQFKARGHLLVTVPIYIRWDRLDWEDR